MTSHESILRRNKLLEEFFNKYFLGKNIKIIGDKHSPSVIYNDKEILCCYVHNFWLIFKYSFEDEPITYKHKLGTKSIPVNIEALYDWFQMAFHRECYTVGAKNTFLKLAGYNFLKKEQINPEGKYPVFANHGYKIYFTKEKADTIVEEFSGELLELEVL